MEDNFKAWKAVVAEYGLDLKPEDYYPLEGLSVRELPKRFFEKYHVPVPDEKEVVRKKEKHYLENHRFSFYPGVEELIKTLRSKGIPIGLVTSGFLNRLTQTAPAGFLEQFDAVVTGDETKEGKPSPVPYLRGAQKLKVKAKECIAVENAPLGIQSAKRAGAYCIAVCSTVDKKYLREADEICDSLQDIKKTSRIKELLE